MKQLTTNITLSFGMHAGKKLSEVPRSYIEWLVTVNKPGVSSAASTFLSETKSSECGDDKYGKFMRGRAYNWGYVGREEFEEANEQQRSVDEEERRLQEEALVCEWISTTAREEIRVGIYVFDDLFSSEKTITIVKNGYWINAINTTLKSLRATTSSERAKNPAVVAVIGGIGLTQERKDALLQKIAQRKER